MCIRDRTYLTCEENFNGYFGTNDEKWTPTDAQARYGFNNGGFGYDWHSFDERFDLADDRYENEHNRFGWVVEIDPRNPGKKPVKHTALGRFKHEGVEVTVGKDGRIVAYMGDDERFDYIYKFVSAEHWLLMAFKGMHPLAHGALYVARFDDDGTGEWIELTVKDPRIAKEMASQEEVLVNARMAADLVGATPMDRPEWASVAPNGDVFITCTNNTNRTEPDAANPEAPNPNGHIIKSVSYTHLSDAELSAHRFRAQVNVTDRAVTVWDGPDMVVETTAVVGKPATPTPLGRFFVNDLIEKWDTSAYGPYILSLSGFSEALETFGGGIPVIAIHGTNRPELMGGAHSNGCIRIPNDIVRVLADTVPIGTPVDIVA